MTLTKAAIVEQVYATHENLTKAQATEAVEAILRLSNSISETRIPAGEETRKPVPI